MQRIILAGLAASSLASPAMAMDHSWYAGIEGGLLWPKNATVRANEPGGPSFDYIDIDYKRGIDADLIAGYDFGMFRVEGELGYKRAKHDAYEVDFGNEGG
ncbi:MAG: hypothetical protein ABIN68_06715 [Sphingomicrobium sp.]